MQELSNIVKDADALDRNRIKLFPFSKCNPDYLRFEESKEIYQDADILFKEYQLAKKRFKKMDKYKITIEDIKNNYFHFTLEKNLKSIRENGLIPNKGQNAKYIEKTKKIFFVEGLDNLLILLDCWINVYYYKPKIPFIYTLGANFLRQKWFPQFIADGYFKVLK